MTFKEWGTARDDSIKFAEETIKSMANSKENSELSKLFGAAYNDTVTDEIRAYNKNIMMTLTEEDLYQIAGALNKIAEELANAPRIMFKKPETTSRGHWIPTTNCNYKCSCCGNGATGDDMKFCPECGAKMYVEVDKVVDDLMKELANEEE